MNGSEDGKGADRYVRYVDGSGNLGYNRVAGIQQVSLINISEIQIIRVRNIAVNSVGE